MYIYIVYPSVLINFFLDNFIYLFNNFNNLKACSVEYTLTKTEILMRNLYTALHNMPYFLQDLVWYQIYMPTHLAGSETLNLLNNIYPV